MRRWISAVVLVGFSGNIIMAGNWPAWRGDAAGSGITPEKNLPTHWSATQNVKWRIKLPDIGNSTPVVWGDRVFITQWIRDENFRGTICFDRETGKQLWKAGVTYTGKEKTHPANPYCSASPVTDGERVIASYGPAGLACYDFEGKELWIRKWPPVEHIWGWASSPVIYKDLCIHYFGPGEGAFLIVLDKNTGKTIWKFAEPKWDTSNRTDGAPQRPGKTVGSFATPIVVKINGRDELIMAFPTEVRAFDPRTGKEYWRCRGLNPLVYCCPVFGNGIVVAMGGYYGNSLAIKAGGSGDVTDQRLWHKIRHNGSVGSGVVKDSYLFYHNSRGTVYCYDLMTGKQIWENTRSGKRTKVWSSMVLSGDDNIYLIDQKGETRIFKAAPEYKEVAINSLGEKTNASIAVSDGDLFVRTHDALWCIGK